MLIKLRKCSWFCDLLWNNYFISLIICNILIEIGIIGFEKKLNEDLEKNKLYKNIIIIIIYLLLFILFAILGRYILKDNLYEFLPENFKKIKKFIGNFILIPFILFYIIFSIYIIFLFIILILKAISKILFEKFFRKIIELVEIFIDYFIILISVSFVKFLNFFETELFLVILDKSALDILSGLFVLSSFYIIYDIIVFIITDTFDCDTKILIWVQIGFSASIFIFFIIVPAKT